MSRLDMILVSSGKAALCTGTETDWNLVDSDHAGVKLWLDRNAQVQVWLAPVSIHSCVGAIANEGRWEQGCSLPMSTDLGPVRATREKKNLLSKFPRI